MWGYYYNGAGMPAWMIISSVSWLVLVGVAVWALVRWVGSRRNCQHDASRTTSIQPAPLHPGVLLPCFPANTDLHGFFDPVPDEPPVHGDGRGEADAHAGLHVEDRCAPSTVRHVSDTAPTTWSKWKCQWSVGSRDESVISFAACVMTL